MNQQEITQGNKLIAEFMGIDLAPLYIQHDFGRADVVFVDGGYSECKYDESWDWLMPVVEKIEGLPVVDRFEISDSRCLIVAYQSENVKLEVINNHANNGRYFNHSHYFASKIEATYKALLQFIQWYNANKSKIT